MSTHIERKLYFNSNQGVGIHVWYRFVNGIEQKGVVVGSWDYIPKEEEYIWLDDESYERFEEYVKLTKQL